MIEFENVNKSYGSQKVIEDLSLSIKDGELAVLIGSSGCGKTTILKMINRLESPTSGTILINDKDTGALDATELRRQMGYVIQQTGLFIHMTVEENIGIILKLKGTPKDEIKKKTTDMLEMVGLDPKIYRKRYPAQLSGGQTQRIGVARAFATDPKIILMDEPFSALDPITRAQLRKELKTLHAKTGKTIVFVTHDIDEAIQIADRICIINGGKIEQFDTPENILARPASEYVSKFIGENRIWEYPEYLTVKHIMIPDSFPIIVPDMDKLLVFDENTKLVDIVSKIDESGRNIFAVSKNGEVIGSFTRMALIKAFIEHMGKGEE